jgi:membrane protease YdiL (CAAX protease family)
MLTWLFGPPRGLPTSPWGPVGGVFAVLFATVMAVVFAGIVMLGIVAVTPGLRQAVETRCAGGGGQCITALLAAMALVYLFLVVGLIVACWFRRGATAGNSLMLRSAHWRAWQYLVFAVVTVASLIILQQIIFWLSDQLGIASGEPSADLEQMRQYLTLDQPATLIIMGVLAVILAPLAEEFVFRGMLFAAFHKTIGVIGSAILLSALWSVMHWGYSSQNLVALFVLGLLFAYITWRTGSLWPAIVGHTANNLVAVVALLSSQA